MGAKRKQEVKALLRARDIKGLDEWARQSRRALSVLFSFTYDPDPLIRWRAIEATGRAARVLQDSSTEKTRDFIRRLLWLMNDESGGVGWSAPEVIGEVLVNVPALIPDYGGLLPHYFEEEPFERGALFAFARVGRVAPELVREHRGRVLKMVNNSDILRSLYAAMALHHANLALPESALERLLTSDDEVTLYDFDSGQLRKRAIQSLLAPDERTLPIAGIG